MNEQKELLTLIDNLKEQQETVVGTMRCGMSDRVLDQRWISIAQTHFEQGLMALKKGLYND